MKQKVKTYMAPNISDLLNQGTRVLELPDHLRPSKLPKMAALSIRAGLRSYFSTYRAVGVSTPLSEPADRESAYAVFRQENGVDYLELYTETILHLHFGIELAIKELLRQKHPLLASSSMPDSAVLLCQILHNEEISFDEEETLKSAEFSEALKRVITLTREGLIHGDLAIITNNKSLLEEMNRLRNRIVHRGLFVLDYSAFELAVYSQLIPFLIGLLELSHFVIPASARPFAALTPETPEWKYKKLDCGIDPLDEIRKISGESENDRRKLAFLKELARAAYENPLEETGSMWASMAIDDSAIKHQAALHAQYALKNQNPCAYEGANELLKCPVCGQETLVRYNDADGYDVEVKCTCCTFGVLRSLGNASVYGLALSNFWDYK